MNARAVLVTGGAGFIGSHTCKLLAAQGFLPVAYDNLSVGHRDAVRWGPLIEADIADAGAMARACAEHRPSAVMHFAACAYVGESVLDPEKYYRNNVTGTIAMLRVCRTVGVPIVVYSSSCATYGVPATLPIAESAPQVPISPYGRTKLIGEQILEDYAQAYGLRYAALRYFNACGADPDGELSERHDPETHLIPRALLAASGRIDQLEIFGDDYPTPDGTCVRDYIHVSDLARAHCLALQHLLGGGDNLRLNLGAGRGASVRDVTTAVFRTTRRKVPFVVKPRRSGDPAELYADGSLARKTLGFFPELSDLETIVRTAAPCFGLSTVP
jgi:UDP-arabinose 4-epimerase